MRVWVYHIGLLVQAFVLSYIYIEGKNGMKDVYALKKEAEETNNRVAQLSHSIDFLKQDIIAWNNDSFFKEKIARENLHMARKGDTVYDR